MLLAATVSYQACPTFNSLCTQSPEVREVVVAANQFHMMALLSVEKPKVGGVGRYIPCGLS